LPQDNQLDPERWVEQHGDVLYRYALVRIGDSASAEDLVQETLLAAVRSQAKFRGQSTERTWLVGILRNKIVDLIRKQSRVTIMSSPEELEAEVDQFFHSGSFAHWAQAPRSWKTHPRHSVEQTEFWEILQQCLDHLNQVQHRAFTLRELEGINLEELCNILSVSATNIRVILHRARLGLRQCLEENWFVRERKGGRR
jgi:RNA polymerase sigma-70 factor (ECF subfamily)